jgi:hypothetical protein
VRSLGAAEVVDYRSPTAVGDLVAATRRAGVEIRYAVDAISTEETLPLVLEFLGQFKGAGKMKLAHLWIWSEQVALPEEIEATFVGGVMFGRRGGIWRLGCLMSC